MIQGQFYTTIKVQQPYNKAVFFILYSKLLITLWKKLT